MAKTHSAAAGKLTRELTAAVLAEFDRWKDHAVRQNVTIWADSLEDVARMSLEDVRSELDDHLATYGITADGETEYRPRTAEEALRHSFRTGERPCGKCGGKGWQA